MDRNLRTNFKKDFAANTSGFFSDSIFTKLKKITPIIVFLALLFFFISYGSPYWAESTDETRRPEHIGLWRHCSEDFHGKENCDDFINYNYNDWLKSAQSFMTLAMFAFFITLPAYVAYVFVGGFHSDKRILILALGSSGVTVGLLIIGMCSFAFRYDEYFWQRDDAVPHDESELSWAFYLALVSTLFTILASFLVVLEIFAEKYVRDEDPEDGL